MALPAIPPFTRQGLGVHHMASSLDSNSEPTRTTAGHSANRLSQTPSERSISWRRNVALGLLFLSGLTGLTAPGCTCNKTASTAAKKKAEEEEAKKKLKKQKAKPDFEITALTTYPDDPDNVQNFVKPGHWVTITQKMRANNFDFQADYELGATDRDGRPYLVEDTDFHLRHSRPTSLPKGQARTLEMTTYVPRVPRGNAMLSETKKVWLETRLLAARGGNKVNETREGTTELLDYEYFFVVLARESTNFRFLKLTDAVSLPAHGQDSGRVIHYRVILPPTSEFVAIPSHPLTWTSIAYVLWDELDPKSLTTDQQQAMLDWLHWGGQLIINGPDTLDVLKASFLSPYLPVEKTDARDLVADDLRELDAFWSTPSLAEPPADTHLHPRPDRPLLGIAWNVHPEARVIENTGGLVCERRVGGGRIVVTAFPMEDQVMREWKSFDNFLNGCLLRRPGRDFRELANLNDESAQPIWHKLDSGMSNDPRLLSNVRFFTRDIGGDGRANSADDTGQTPGGAPGSRRPSAAVESFAGPQAGRVRPTPTAVGQFSPSTGDANPALEHTIVGGLYNDRDDYRFRGATVDPLSGVGGWNDDSGAAHAVLEAIREAAGIKIPEAAFVLRMVALYLLVLVPVNWGVFRLMGRVEWAWLAVPVIAVVGAIVVIRMAQLDIGFVRSRREVAVLELQGGYNRGHLTRYSLLYSSLSTGYDISFSDPSAVAQPLSKGQPATRGLYQPIRSVDFRRDDQVRLRDFLVSSNSTELLHSEHMLPIEGALSLEGDEPSGWKLHNRGVLTLRDVGLVRRTPAVDRGVNDDSPASIRSFYELAWIGQLAPGSSVDIQFERREGDGIAPFAKPWFEQWESSSVTTRSAANRGEGELSVARLFELALHKMMLGPGDVRLLGWTDEDLPGIKFEPGAAQTTVRTMVVCHLRRGTLPPIERDENVRTDYFAPKPESEDGTNESSNEPSDEPTKPSR